MGSSYTRPSSYSGKGSSSQGTSTTKTSSSLTKVVGICEKLDESKKLVAVKEQELAKAKEDLVAVESKLQSALGDLDPGTKAMVRAMLDGKDAGQDL